MKDNVDAVELAEVSPVELQQLLEDELGLAVGDTGCAAFAAPIRQE
ncbi:hypothetical protein Ais01nite_01940 [Asanoa ishikariensis]|uniref:Uncharacterized protein n=1 Tax=Asanoa ishikariensis TaxID=137265 RepID=A0A1H3TLV2_9ACTN|nr:hypothetical protein [Asanoa ishikariensis]GIF62159.1 hypothetical protein Ais01nite_01940 [Asanoa ishikariensis]SDZ51196.1 hypothetical protein SAMN05421684_6028 [Asanoa ishikariensis]